MAWKTFRPSIRHTICDSMFIGSLISLLAAIGILYVVPVYTLWLCSSMLQFYLVARHFLNRPKWKRILLLCKMFVPTICFVILGFCTRYFIYPAYNKKKERRKKAGYCPFSPLAGLVLKAASRICVQRLWNITHPGYSYVLLAPLYFVSAIMIRGLQLELNSLQSIAIFGIIHEAAEVIERSTIVVTDHVCFTSDKKGISMLKFSNSSPGKTTSRCSYHEYVVRINGYSFRQWLLLHVPTDLSRNDFCHKHNSRVCPFHFSHAGNRMVFHQRFSSNRDSISRHGCYGCMALSI